MLMWPLLICMAVAQIVVTVYHGVKGAPGEGCHWASLHVTTRRLNKPLGRIGSSHRRLLRFWFSAGLAAGALASAGAALLLLREVTASVSLLLRPLDGEQAKRMAAASEASGQLQLLVPGVTVPWAQVPLVLLCFATAAAVHEAGHALAAAAEGVAVLRLGVLLLGGLPAAYLSLDTSALDALPLTRRLKVVCAGVWHNVALCALCVLASTHLPLLLSPAYASGKGALVRSVAPTSPLATYLAPGAIIHAVGGCQVATPADWQRCMQQAAQSGAAGTCVPRTALHAAPLCFPRAAQPAGCLPMEVPNNTCSNGEACVRPVLPPGMTLVALHYTRDWRRQCVEDKADPADPAHAPTSPEARLRGRRSATATSSCTAAARTAVLLAPAPELSSSLSLEALIPRCTWLPDSLPGVIAAMLSAMFAVSGGMALLNALPVHALDGAAAVDALLTAQTQWLGAWPGARHRRAVRRSVVGAGTALLALVLVLHATRIVRVLLLR